MSAERMREAAALMREQAEKAEPGRWKLWGMAVMADPKGTSDVDDAIEVGFAATPSWCERAPRTWNAQHIASWHPAVALAVADWLEVVAGWLDEGLGIPPQIEQTNWPDMWVGVTDAALVVATAYLGADE